MAFGKSMTGARGASSAGLAKVFSGTVLVIIALAAWVLVLSGLSVVRNYAGTNQIFGGIEFSWFVMFGSLFVYLATLIYLIGHTTSLLPVGHNAIIGLLAVFTTLIMLETNRWYHAYKSTPYTTSEVGKGAVTTFAGYITMSVLNSFLILAIGNTATVRRDDDLPSGPAHIHHHNNVGTAPVGGVPVASAV